MGLAVGGGGQFPKVKFFFLFRIMSGYVAHDFSSHWVIRLCHRRQNDQFRPSTTEVKTVKICL